jgi:uncharacterized protein (DUF2267 family)
MVASGVVREVRGVDYDEFIERVAQRAGVPRQEAEVLTRATLEVLAERISGGEAEDLAERLPEPLRNWVRPPDELAKGFGLKSFVRRVRDHAGGVPSPVALEGIRAVLTTLREAVGDPEFRDATAQLPEEFEEMLQPVE